MFNKKKNQELKERIEKLEELIDGPKYHPTSLLGIPFTFPPHWTKHIGIENRLKNSENEVAKLKALVRELCDYVYREKEDAK